MLRAKWEPSKGETYANIILHVSSEYSAQVAKSSWFPIVTLVPKCMSYLAKFKVSHEIELPDHIVQAIEHA